MELKHLVQRFVYRIEPKPEGGFIARATDPTVPPLEAPTREELQQKIQAKLLAELGEQFPGLKLAPLENKQVKWEVHIDRKPGGGFTVHSDQPGTASVDPATSEKIDHFAEELLGFVDRNFPQLSQTIASQVSARALKLFTAGETSASLDSSLPPSGPQGFLPTQPLQSPDAKAQDVKLEATTIEGTALNNAAFSNTPITPETSGSATIFRFVLTLLVIVALMYFFFYRR